MTSDIHSCSYFCDRPECVKAQRDALRDELEMSGGLRAKEERDALRAEVERLTSERNAAFAMSKCECSADECCANLVRANAERDALRRDAERYRWLREQTTLRKDFYEDGPRWNVAREFSGYGECFSGERLDAALDAAMAANATPSPNPIPSSSQSGTSAANAKGEKG